MESKRGLGFIEKIRTNLPLSGQGEVLKWRKEKKKKERGGKSGWKKGEIEEKEKSTKHMHKYNKIECKFSALFRCYLCTPATGKRSEREGGNLKLKARGL